MNPFQKERDQILQNKKDYAGGCINLANLIVNEINDPESNVHNLIKKEYGSYKSICLPKSVFPSRIAYHLDMLYNYPYILDSDSADIVWNILKSVPNVFIYIRRKPSDSYWDRICSLFSNTYIDTYIEVFIC